MWATGILQTHAEVTIDIFSNLSPRVTIISGLNLINDSEKLIKPKPIDLLIDTGESELNIISTFSLIL